MDPIIFFSQSQVIPLLFVTLMRNGGEPLVAANVRATGPFLESPGNFSGPEGCFVSARFAFEIKVVMNENIS